MTVVVGVTRVCAAGDWETATPLPSTRSISPQERKSRLADATDMPVTSGTKTRSFSSVCASPSTYSMTSEPSLIPAPGAGSWPSTVAPVPESTCASPAAFSASMASETDRPVTSGTGTSSSGSASVSGATPR